MSDHRHHEEHEVDLMDSLRGRDLTHSSAAPASTDGVIDLDRTFPTADVAPTGLCGGCGALSYAHTQHGNPACPRWPDCGPSRSPAFRTLAALRSGDHPAEPLSDLDYAAAYELAEARHQRPEAGPARSWLALDDERATAVLEAVAWMRAARSIGLTR